MKLISFRFLPFAILLLFFSCKQKSTQPEEKVAEKKDELIVLNDQIKEKPQADLYFKRAQLFAQRKVLTQALEDMNRAVALDSSRTDYYMFMADLSFRTLQIQNSVKQFEKVIALDPKNIEANLKLSEIYLYTKGYQQCLHYADEALKINKNKAKAYFLKGFAFKEMGDTVHAISSFQTVVEVEPENYDAYIQLGNIQAARRNKSALLYYNNALRLSPKSIEALYDRGLMYQNMGELESAKADYKAILAIDPADADANHNLGFIALVYEKDYKTAVTYLSNAIRTNDQFVEAIYNRGLAYEFLGDKEAAMKDFNAAVRILPTYKPALQKLKKG